jgi:hypothetical protein
MGLLPAPPFNWHPSWSAFLPSQLLLWPAPCKHLFHNMLQFYWAHFILPIQSIYFCHQLSYVMAVTMNVFGLVVEFVYLLQLITAINPGTVDVSHYSTTSFSCVMALNCWYSTSSMFLNCPHVSEICGYLLFSIECFYDIQESCLFSNSHCSINLPTYNLLPWTVRKHPSSLLLLLQVLTVVVIA